MSSRGSLRPPTWIVTDHGRTVQDYYTRRQARPFSLRYLERVEKYRRVAVTFEEYAGEASDGDDNVRRFIEAGEGHAFPLGTVDTFATYFAPADFNETANTLGQPLYAKQEPRKFDRGTDLHTQSNPLPMCHRPGVLIKLVAA